MMRSLMILSLAMTAACDGGGDYWEGENWDTGSSWAGGYEAPPAYEGSESWAARTVFEEEIQGAAFLPGRDEVISGIYGQSCGIDPDNGDIGSDYDLDWNDVDTVVDEGNGNTVIVATQAGVHGWDIESGSAVTWELPGALDAASTPEGVIALSQPGFDCVVNWRKDFAWTQVIIPGKRCDGPVGFDVDPDDGEAWVGTPDGLDKVDVEGNRTPVDPDGDLVAWDAIAKVLYVGQYGGTTLHGVEKDGTVRWTVDVGGRMAALKAVDGMAYVSIDTGDGGGIRTVDGLTGKVGGDLRLPRVATRLDASPDGTRMVLGFGTHSAFFTRR